jgi:hypothetical protein
MRYRRLAPARSAASAAARLALADLARDPARTSRTPRWRCRSCRGAFAPLVGPLRCRRRRRPCRGALAPLVGPLRCRRRCPRLAGGRCSRPCSTGCRRRSPRLAGGCSSRPCSTCGGRLASSAGADGAAGGATLGVRATGGHLASARLVLPNRSFEHTNDDLGQALVMPLLHLPQHLRQLGIELQTDLLPLVCHHDLSNPLPWAACSSLSL